MNDRFTSGFIAGIAANIPALIIDKIISVLELKDVDFVHFAAALAFEGQIDSTVKWLFALAVEMMFAGFLGTLFILALALWTPKYYYFKGALFGACIWFTIHVLDVIFKIPEILNINFASAVVHYFVSIVWGVLTAYIYRQLEKKQYFKA